MTVVVEISTCTLLVQITHILSHLQMHTTLSIYTYDSQHIQPNCCHYMYNNQSQQWSVYTHWSILESKTCILSTARNVLFKQNIGEIFFVIAVSIVMHTFYLCINALVVSKYIMRIPVKQAVSVIIMASQKSSPVALAVITSIANTNTQQKGLFAIPCIIGQLTQIFIGSFIAKKLAKWVEASEVAPVQQEVEVDNNNNTGTNTNVIVNGTDEVIDRRKVVPIVELPKIEIREVGNNENVILVASTGSSERKTSVLDTLL
jgi:hypothetical protein